MNPEAWILNDLLHFGMRFLFPIPDVEETKLAEAVVRDARQMFSKVVWERTDLPNLMFSWFMKGRTYEGSVSILDPYPTDVHTALSSMATIEIEEFSTLIAADIEALCRLLWVWFQRGRSYERGNAV